MELKQTLISGSFHLSPICNSVSSGMRWGDYFPCVLRHREG